MHMKLVKPGDKKILTIEDVLKDFMEDLTRIEKVLKGSYSNPNDLSENLDGIENADRDNILSSYFPFIRHAISERVIGNFIDTQPSERDIHDWFRDNFKRILGEEYRIVDHKNNKNHIPDFWVTTPQDFKIVPVEIKLHSFDHKSLEQLKRYMNFYESDRGIAVGKKLKCELPENITFINYIEAWRPIAA